MRGLWLISAMLLLQSCGAKYHLKRAIAKDPTILDSVVVQVDTTVITQKEEIRDTLIFEQIDTIKIEKDGVRVELKRFYDTIMVDVECLPDTIQVVKSVQIPKVVYKEPKITQADKIVFGILIFFFTMLMWRMVK